MKLKIEKWLVEQNVSASAMQLFDESIKSYNASAYKASLLYSYLGFMTILKERILKADPPPHISQPHWSSIQKGVIPAEGWDKKVFEATQQKAPGPIFQITDTLRNEVLYWKDRRNDCAHFKHENIYHHHIESLWSFMQSNIGKFAVNGGSAALLGKFKDHFDPSVTRPGSSFDHLVHEIGHSVEAADLPAFYASITQEFDPLYDDTQDDIFDKILTVYNSHISEALINYIKADTERLIDFLRKYSNRLNRMALNAPLVRTIWHTYLFVNWSRDYEIYTGLLQNNLIPPEDIEEAHRHILTKASAKVGNITEFQSAILEQYGFYPILKATVFPAGGFDNFNRGNSFANLTLHYLKKFPIDNEVVTSLCNSLNNAYPPFAIRDSLDRCFQEHPDKKNEFRTVVTGAGIAITGIVAGLLA